MTEDHAQNLHQNSGQEHGQGFQLLEEAENWTDDDVLYEFSIWVETVGYARVTREVDHDWIRRGLTETTYHEDDLSNNLEEGTEDGNLFGDLYLERRNDLEEAPIINNGDENITETGRSYQILVDGEYVGEAIMAGEGLEQELWMEEDDYTGEIQIEDPTSSSPGRLEF